MPGLAVRYVTLQVQTLHENDPNLFPNFSFRSIPQLPSNSIQYNTIFRKNKLNRVHTSINKIANETKSLLLDKRLRICKLNTIGTKLHHHHGKRTFGRSVSCHTKIFSLPETRLANEEAVSSKKMPSLHTFSARNTKFLKARKAFDLTVESIDFVNWTSCFMPPHCTNADLCVVKSMTMFPRALRAATWKIEDWKEIHYRITNKKIS